MKRISQRTQQPELQAHGLVQARGLAAVFASCQFGRESAKQTQQSCLFQFELVREHPGQRATKVWSVPESESEFCILIYPMQRPAFCSNLSLQIDFLQQFLHQRRENRCLRSRSKRQSQRPPRRQASIPFAAAPRPFSPIQVWPCFFWWWRP